jgi:hypothetical protein
MIKISIVAGKITIGAIETLTIKESHNTHPEIWVSRMRMDRAKLADIFTNGDFYVAAQRWPFHILIEDSGETQIIKMEAHNIWMSSIGKYYMSQDWIIAEDINLQAEYVSTSVSLVSGQ